MVTLHKILGALWILFGASLLLPLYAVISTTIGYQDTDPDMYEGLSLVAIITIWIISILYPSLSISNGIMIFRYIRRRLSLVISTIMCSWFPFGTLLGLLSWFFLTRQEIKQTYKD
jgi:hypothetical protein